MTNNDIQNTTQKTKDRATNTNPTKTEDELLCLGRASSSCSTCDTRRVTVKLTRTSSDMEIVLDAVWFIFLLATYCSIAWWHIHKTDVYKTKMLIFFTFFFEFHNRWELW
jgi:hypothetical protein